MVGANPPVCESFVRLLRGRFQEFEEFNTRSVVGYQVRKLHTSPPWTEQIDSPIAAGTTKIGHHRSCQYSKAKSIAVPIHSLIKTSYGESDMVQIHDF
jgi:hypothetical protein